APRARSAEPARRAEVDVGTAAPGLLAAKRRADDDVAEAIAVDVSRGRHRSTEGLVLVLARRSPVRSLRRARCRAEVDEDRAAALPLVAVVVLAFALVRGLLGPPA